MHDIWKYANGCLWPKADIRTKSKSMFLNVRFGEKSSRSVLRPYDELLFEGPKAEAASAAELVRERMEGVASLAVPLSVDVGVGENWLDAKP